MKVFVGDHCGVEKAPEPVPRPSNQCTCGKPRREVLRDGSLMETHLPYCQVGQKTQVFR